jgi:hypothetical protein
MYEKVRAWFPLSTVTLVSLANWVIKRSPPPPSLMISLTKAFQKNKSFVYQYSKKKKKKKKKKKIRILKAT